jgi:hypothetical protein
VAGGGSRTWRDLEAAAPQLTGPGLDCIRSTRVALLGTVRRDGSPRISPIEPHFVNDDLLVGAMAWSAKAADLRRDPRYVLHSAVTGPDTGEPELKLYGVAVEAAADLRGAAAEAWWASRPADKAVVFCLRIDRAVVIEWAVDAGLMTVHQWSDERGYTVSRRAYP